MNSWKFYSSNELHPSGWLKQQLVIQASGLSGNLDKVWKDVRDSAWIGGTAEGWERVPYWLDGFIPLAYLLEDSDLIARAKKYMDAILAAQKPDGWICPCDDEKRATYDAWAVLLISKVMTVYYECSHDERIPDVLYRVLHNYYEFLKSGQTVLTGWGKFRWFEGLIAIEFLSSRYDESWIPELAEILQKQGQDYNELMPLWERPLNRWRLETHIVNLAMSLKYEALSCMLSGKTYTDRAEALYQQLYRFNGTPVGLFTGDECLSGLSPIQGTELCAVVEQMYSYEWLFACTGDSKWLERLELIAFNALPATFSDDMWAHQYDQMSNQMACQKFPGRPIFRTNEPDAHLFGLEPNYGCCTANFNQGWPKFALSAFFHRDNTILHAIPVPAVLQDERGTIRVESEYPFQNALHYCIDANQAFTLQIRIPSFAKNLRVNGAECAVQTLSFGLAAGESKKISIAFDTAPVLESRPYGLTTAKCGSLIFSVPVSYEAKRFEYERNGVERKFPYCDYEYIPCSPWNYAYLSAPTDLTYHGISAVPFSSCTPPVTLQISACQIPWGFADGYDTVCAKVPESRLPLENSETVLTLYPYGCAKLRMTELPLLSSEDKNK